MIDMGKDAPINEEVKARKMRGCRLSHIIRGAAKFAYLARAVGSGSERS